MTFDQNLVIAYGDIGLSLKEAYIYIHELITKVYTDECKLAVVMIIYISESHELITKVMNELNSPIHLDIYPSKKTLLRYRLVQTSELSHGLLGM